MTLAADLLDDARLALGFLTRLPVAWPEASPLPALARAMRLFPLIGAGIGLAVGCLYTVFTLLVPDAVAALLALAAGMLLTGALHEDGLADCADGFGGGFDASAKLAIMKDSRIGSYGAIALIVSLTVRAAALTGLATPGRVIPALITAHSVARALLPVAMLRLAPASDRGLAAAAGRPAPADAGVATLLALALAALCLPPPAALAAVLAAAAAVAMLGRLAQRQIGGYSGDVLGAMEQLAEIAALLAILAVLRRSA